MAVTKSPLQPFIKITKTITPKILIPILHKKELNERYGDSTSKDSRSENNKVSLTKKVRINLPDMEISKDEKSSTKGIPSNSVGTSQKSVVQILNNKAHNKDKKSIIIMDSKKRPNLKNQKKMGSFKSSVSSKSTTGSSIKELQKAPLLKTTIFKTKKIIENKILPIDIKDKTENVKKQIPPNSSDNVRKNPVTNSVSKKSKKKSMKKNVPKKKLELSDAIVKVNPKKPRSSQDSKLKSNISERKRFVTIEKLSGDQTDIEKLKKYNFLSTNKGDTFAKSRNEVEPIQIQKDILVKKVKNTTLFETQTEAIFKQRISSRDNLNEIEKSSQIIVIPRSDLNINKLYGTKSNKNKTNEKIKEANRVEKSESLVKLRLAAQTPTKTFDKQVILTNAFVPKSDSIPKSQDENLDANSYEPEVSFGISPTTTDLFQLKRELQDFINLPLMFQASKEGDKVKHKISLTNIKILHPTEIISETTFDTQSSLNFEDAIKKVRRPLKKKKKKKKKIESKVGTWDNYKFKSTGGNFVVPEQKLKFREMAKSKIGSLANIKFKPGGGNFHMKEQEVNFKKLATSKVDSSWAKKSFPKKKSDIKS